MKIGMYPGVKIALLNYTLSLNMYYNRIRGLEYFLRGRNINLGNFNVYSFLLTLPYYLIKDSLPSAFPLDKKSFLSRISHNVKKARSEGAELIILYIHWGRQYHYMPSLEQRELALSICLQGVDIIIGSGPHVIQPMEKIFTKGNEVINHWEERAKEHLIAYSLGNFLSNQRGLCEYGMMLEITIGRAEGRISLMKVSPHVVLTITRKEELFHNGYSRSINTYQLEIVKRELPAIMLPN